MLFASAVCGCACLCPQAVTPSASVSTEAMVQRRRLTARKSSASRASKRSLGLDRHALTAIAPFLEDRPQTAHRLARVALAPRAAAERVHQLVRQLRGDGLERVLDLGCVARAGGQRVGPDHSD